MHCVCWLFMLATRKVGRVRLGATLIRTLKTMFKMEEVMGRSYWGVGGVRNNDESDAE